MTCFPLRGTVRIKKGEGRLLKSGGVRIFDNEIAETEAGIPDGCIVRVLDFDGYPLGRGLWNSRSKIRVRMLTRRADQEIDEEFLRMRVRAAWDYRKACVDTSSCRLIFGEADFLPGLTVDKYEDVLAAECLSLGMETMKVAILGLLAETLSEDGVRIRGIYERSGSKERLREGMDRFEGFLSDPFDPEVLITENGIRYLVNVAEGQKTGFFLDQKYNRQAIRPMCRGARVLDCFTHTGSFALNAAAAGAESVLAVDASETGILQGEKNARLNEMEDIVRFQQADVFELLPSLIEKGEPYDLVILDPPAFAKSRASVKNAERGYREINRRGMTLVRDGGFLATCSCSHFMTEELFSAMLHRAANDAHRRIRQVEFRTQSPDHPILWAADETYYLKFYILQVFEER